MVTRVEEVWQGRRSLPPLVVDAALALGLTLLLWASATPEELARMTPFGLLMTAPLIWRRRWPLPVFLLVVAGAVIAQAPPAGIIAAMVAAYSVGAYFPHRLLSLGILLVTATAIFAAFGGGLPPLPQWSGPYAILIPLWLVGDTIHTWRARAAAFRDRATRLEREQEQAARAAVAEEQARIARELHDVVAHSVSVMVVQAGAARHVVKTSPEQAGEALLAVEASGREAMSELRHLLGLLNQDGDGMALTPQPGAEQLEALVRRVRDAGLPVTLRVEGPPRPLPPGLNLTVYRIVQEALTNALKYSGRERTEVVLQYRECELKVEVLDEGAGLMAREGGESGRGLIGMRERVALYGGTLEAGPRLERGYAVRAWLPLTSDCP